MQKPMKQFRKICYHVLHMPKLQKKTVDWELIETVGGIDIWPPFRPMATPTPKTGETQCDRMH